VRHFSVSDALADLISGTVQTALCAKSFQSLAQTFILSANLELKRSPDYQAQKDTLKDITSSQTSPLASFEEEVIAR